MSACCPASTRYGKTAYDSRGTMRSTALTSGKRVRCHDPPADAVASGVLAEIDAKIPEVVEILKLRIDIEQRVELLRPAVPHLQALEALEFRLCVAWRRECWTRRHTASSCERSCRGCGWDVKVCDRGRRQTMREASRNEGPGRTLESTWRIHMNQESLSPEDSSRWGRFVPILMAMGDVLTGHGHFGQSEVTERLVRLAGESDGAFLELLQSVDVWGGAGAVWEVGELGADKRLRSLV